MRKALFAICLVLFCSVAAYGQATPTSKLGWTQGAPTLADAQAYTYKYYPDGSVTGVQFSIVTCAGTVSPFDCTTAFPAFTPGNHTIQISASNIAGEGEKSDPLSFNFVVTPEKTGTPFITNK